MDVISIAKSILDKVGAIPSMKLQKLVYYCQVYYLVTCSEVLFDNEIQAWVNGPTVVDLSDACEGKFVVSKEDLPLSEDPACLSEKQEACIDYVVDRLGSWTSGQLGEQTNKEAPWLDQRKGLTLGERCNRVIEPEAIKLFYSSPACDNPLFS